MGDMAQVVECLLCKCEALSLNPVLPKQKQNPKTNKKSLINKNKKLLKAFLSLPKQKLSPVPARPGSMLSYTPRPSM
jgi:hypothetical protein